MATTTTLPVLRLGMIDLADQGSIAIVDLSSYDPALPLIASFQITPPGWPTLNVPFTKGSVNVYKCGDLGIVCPIVDCCPLPDGIYAVTYSVTKPASGQVVDSIKKTFIKTDQIECRLMNLFLKVDLECDCNTDDQEKYKEQIKEIDLLINGAKAAANTCDDLSALKFYEQADNCINRIYSKFCLYCGPVPSCDQCS